MWLSETKIKITLHAWAGSCLYSTTTLSPQGKVWEASLDFTFTSTCGLTHFCSASILVCIKSILSITAVCDARSSLSTMLPCSLVAMTTDRAADHLQPSSTWTRLEKSLGQLNSYNDIFNFNWAFFSCAIIMLEKNETFYVLESFQAKQ